MVLEKYSKAVKKKMRQLGENFRGGSSRARAETNAIGVSPSPRFGSSRGRRVVRASPNPPLSRLRGQRSDIRVRVARIFSLFGCRLPEP